MTALIDHLDSQLESARRLLGIVIAQRDAIRTQDVEGVLARLGRACRARWPRARSSSRSATASSTRPPTRARRPAPTRSTSRRILDARPRHDGQRARALSAELKGLAHRDRPRARPEPRADPPGALVPRPPHARPLGHAAGRLLRDGARRTTPQIANAVNRGPTPMSISTFFGLADRALRASSPSSAALDVTAHNIANANTVGYTRQEAHDGARRRLSYPAVSLAAGRARSAPASTSPRYQRIRDEFLDVQLRAQTMRQGNDEAKQDGLDQVELALAEPGDTGLNSLLNKLLGRAGRTSPTRPRTSPRARRSCRPRRALADGFQHALRRSLTTIQTQTAQNVTDHDLARSTRSARRSRAQRADHDADAVGDTPNDLLDQRDVLIDQLAQLGNVSTTAGARRRDRRHVRRRDARRRRDAVGRRSPRADLTSLSSGKLAGLIEPPRHAAARLQGAARRDRERRSSRRRTPLHRTGYDLNGVAGGDFFTPAARRAATIARRPGASSRSPAQHRGAGQRPPGERRRRARDRRHRRIGAAGRRRRDDRRRLLAARDARSAPTRRRRSARSPTRPCSPTRSTSRRDQHLRRLARRGDDEPHEVPARLPGLVPRALTRWTR